MVSLEQSLPPKEALLVEYPGYIREPGAALGTLGGTQAIGAIARGEAPLLQLHFRRDDPLSHPLLGNKKATRGVLLRLKRKRGRPLNPSHSLYLAPT